MLHGIVISVQERSTGTYRVVGAVEQVWGVQRCLQACPQCAQLSPPVRSGCNREAGHVGVHHCSNYNQGPHEW